jgi:hypothetical protein
MDAIARERRDQEVTVGWGGAASIGRYLILALPFVLVLGLILGFITSDRGDPTWVVPAGAAATTGFLFFLAYVQAATAPRRLRISATGLVLSYGWPSRIEMSGDWKDWKPMAGSRVMWWVSLKYMNGSIWYPITPAQARAIFSHPSCPDWELPKGVRRAVGWPTNTVGGATIG